MANFVTIENDNSKIKLNNLMFVGIFIGFVWILFHFTIIYFFGLVLQSVLLVGLFLGLGNFISLLVDIPVGILQNYFKAKKLLLLGASLLFFVSLIFFKFIYFQDLSALKGGDRILPDFLGEFLNSGLNIVLLLFSAILYGLIKEIFDVTTLSYIFNNSTPSEYASLISKFGIHYGGGALIGLVFSGVLLSLNIKVAITIFVIILFLFIFFILKFFDNSKDTIDISQVKNIKNIKNVKVDLMLASLGERASNVIQKITTRNLIELSKKTKLIFLKPHDDLDKKITINELYNKSIENFLVFKKIMVVLPINIVLLWGGSVMLIFGFWDTFVSTFQVDFLNKIIHNNSNTVLIKNSMGLLSGYVLLGIIALPAFLLQDFFIKKTKKYGVYNVIIFGTIISAFSMLFFGMVDSIYLVILFGIMNSIGYAAAMPNSQAVYGELYCIEYSKKYNVKEVDTTFSRAPLRMMLNIANVLGVILGGVFVSIFGFNGFFIIFSLFIMGVAFYSILNLKKFVLLYSPTTQEVSDIKEIVDKDKKIDEDFI